MSEEPQPQQELQQQERTFRQNFNLWHDPKRNRRITEGREMRTESDKAKEAYKQAQGLVALTKKRGLCTVRASELLLQAHYRVQNAVA